MIAATTVSTAAQETCGGIYTVQRGDSLSLIADKLYKDVGQWTAIYRNNIDIIPSPDSIRVGQSYRMPCIDGLPTGLKGGTVIDKTSVAAPRITAAAAPVTAQDELAQRQREAEERGKGVDVRLLAGDDFRPFTNRLQMSSGMITDLVNRAFVADDSTGKHKFYWINDRSVHLDPMLSDGMVDLAFPWKKPQCAEGDTASICTDYVYSEPMFEMLVVLFTAKGRPVTFNSEADLAGMRVCSPLGHDAGSRQGGASYLTKAGARLQQPVTAEECFERLVSGAADAVAMNEFTGRVVLKDMGLSAQVELMLRRPLAIEGLHVVAHKSNPRAEALIGAFDAGLAEMRESGEYLSVIDTHMSSIWAGL
ncbi:LysM peptidoglycan-binding domain-containing protein [Tropicibacter oceani]|uniref:Transporter substrate-binding domain-containing protein n=1 Tax=Tropicibacter oceani TaxID=3058420 RepID=A0ABY8QMS6_9RHOB|nr:transporter substrate-binding domain-containing protein [Tropicibacter oceani]WGW05758.1 transporter substrate-binding domain-containing protein [Tropicibacter oceani]